MPDLAVIPQYAEILTALETAWNTVQTEKTMRVVLIEGASCKSGIECETGF